MFTSSGSPFDNIRLIHLLIWLSGLITPTMLQGQQVWLRYDKEPFNEILLEFNQLYGTEVSINAELSANCLVTVDKGFNSVDKALRYLADHCGLSITVISNIYSLREKETPKASIEKNMVHFLYKGVLREVGSEEPLPFSTIRVGDRYLTSDVNGNFLFKSINKTQYLSFQSLGYQQLDTLIGFGENHILKMEPEPVLLQGVVITSPEGSTNRNIGSNPGHLKLNDINNQLIPGQGYNLIFSKLRLYPGIMASGEAIADYVIWGSYAGQNHIIYDDITIYSNWGINDDIGRINPYMVKNVEVHKGGYNVPFGDRIGGVVLISGRNGNRRRITSRVNINNELAGAYLNLPVFNQSSTLQIAGRKSYKLFGPTRNVSRGRTVIVPDYDFEDLNAKLSINLPNEDLLQVSALTSSDQYTGEIQTGRIGRVINARNVKIDSRQTGTSIKYVRSWKSQGITTLSSSYSRYDPKQLSQLLNEGGDALRSEVWENGIEEYSTRLTHKFPTFWRHQSEMNISHIANKADFQSSFSNSVFNQLDGSLNRISVYGYDKFSVTRKLYLAIGLKADIPLATDKIYWQPRANLNFDVTDRITSHVSWGQYRQFVTRNTVIDELGNLSDIWQVIDVNQNRPPSSQHHTAGLSYMDDLYEISVEGFHKTLDHLSRFAVARDRTFNNLSGQAKMSGLDVFLRRRFQNHEAFVSYSLAEVKEKFQSGGLAGQSEYSPAPQNQTHELKGAAIFNFYPIEFSLVQFLGSGIYQGTRSGIPYRRTDISCQYAFTKGEKWESKLSISLLNCFNRQNVRLNQSINVPNGDVLNTAGIPLTLNINLNIGF